MTELIYRISHLDNKQVEHRISIVNANTKNVVDAMLNLIGYEWHEDAIEEVLRDYLK